MDKLEHMRQRYEVHGSIRKAAEEFGLSKSDFHRKLKMLHEPNEEQEVETRD